jgi:hypothetical protein
MEKLGDALSVEGHKAINLGYPSREHAIETLAVMAIEPALAACNDSTEISFVTHSLGGILVKCPHSLATCFVRFSAFPLVQKMPLLA